MARIERVFFVSVFENRLRGDWEIVFVFASSGLFFALAYFPTTLSTELRYLFWSAIASAAASVWGFYLLKQTNDNFLNKFLMNLRRK